MQIRALFTAHDAIGGEPTGNVILGRWLHILPAAQAVIPGVQSLEWQAVPMTHKPKVPGSDAFYALIDADSVIEACVLVPWFGDEGTWGSRTIDDAKILMVCAERNADSCKN